jgi:ADP-heptose:LPS heptosyltransferase
LKHIPENIILSRTDSIGDVILAMPMAKILKDKFPGIKIALLGKAYTKAAADACVYFDAFIDVEDFLTTQIIVNGEQPQAIIHLNTVSKIAKRAKELKIPVRVGTAGRLYHWQTCNYLVRFSRKRSPLHEAQLNLKLLRPFGITGNFSLKTIAKFYGLKKLQPLKDEFASLIKKDRFNVIIHPKSQGNAREWSMENFTTLIQLLDADKYNIIISGTESERKPIEPLLSIVENEVTDIVGRIPLDQLICFINECDALVANSTGPIHIAAALGKDAIGLYPPLKPKHAGRWGPVGIKSQVFTLNKFCEQCKFTKNYCECINSIHPAIIKSALDKIMNEKMGNTNRL